MSMMQRPLSPQESIKHFVTPTGFRVQLYASEPDLGGKPIAMNWDEQGRLWVCESYDYPNELRTDGSGRDRIRICEDTNQDGVADKFTVFAEELSIPTAITFYRGGAIVQNGVETLYLKDTDGDGKADLRKVLISNWALGDTHGGVSNFRYGHDNWFWAMQGYNNSAPEIEGVRQQSFRMGFFRFKLDQQDPPRVTELEFVRSTNNNTWGLGLTEEGLVTGSTANRNPSVYMPLANRYYERVRGWAPTQLGTMADNHLFAPITDKVRQVDQHGGYTAGAGHAVYTARVYPQQYWNRTAFVCGPTGHLVGTFVLRREGADMNSYSPCNLLASTDEWTAPIAAEVGPDGQVWVLDWYNFIVQHNPTPRGFERGQGNAYETDLRDKRYGRIYRVVYGGNQRAQHWESLAGASPNELVAALRHPTMTWRLHAQRILVERGNRDVVPLLRNMAQDTSQDEIGLNVGVIHALWTMRGLGVMTPQDPATLDLAQRMFSHPSAGVRRAALAAIPLDHAMLTHICNEATASRGVLFDSDSQVRLASLQAIADYQESHAPALQVLADLLSNNVYAGDRWLTDALTSAAAQQAERSGSIPGLIHAGEPAENTSPQTVTRIAEHLARGTPDDVERILHSLARTSVPLAEAAISGLSAGWPKDHHIKLSEAGEGFLAQVLDAVGPAAKGQLVSLAKSFGSRRFEALAKEIATSLFDVVQSATVEDQKKGEAAMQLIALQPQDVEMGRKLLNLITAQASPELTAGLLEAVGQSTAAPLGEAMVRKAAQLTPRGREAAINVLLRRAPMTSALLAGIEQRQLQISDLKLDQRQALSSHPNRDLQDRWNQLLKAAGGLPDPDRQQVIERLLPMTKQVGDVKNGLEMFKKHCAKCHVHGKQGEQVGPNLTGMSVHPKEELLVHILDPTRSVEGNYRQYAVLTVDGQVINGMLAAESKTAIEIIDTDAKRHAIARSDIEQLSGTTKSVMPDGFEKQMSRGEFADLLEFLTDKGKFVPVPLDKVATVISTKGMFHAGDQGADRIIFPKWGGTSFKDVPFYVVDPLGKTKPNIVLLYGPRGTQPPKMPKQVDLPVNMPLRAVHLLSGIGGWSYPAESEQTTSLIVRFRYHNGQTEDHPLKNGVHFADYIRRVDVPKSEFAFLVRGQQVRYLAVSPRQDDAVVEISLIKGDDQTAPIVVAVTLESL